MNTDEEKEEEKEIVRIIFLPQNGRLRFERCNSLRGVIIVIPQ